MSENQRPAVDDTVIVEGAAGRVAVPESAALEQWEPRGYKIVARVRDGEEIEYRHPNHYERPEPIPTGDSYTDIELSQTETEGSAEPDSSTDFETVTR